MLFLRTVLAQNVAVAGDGRVFFDLPVNPLTQILVTLRGTIAESDTGTPLADIYNLVNDLGVAYRGQDIVRGPLRDLAVLNACICGTPPWGERPQGADADTFSLTVPINFGRRPFDPMECFPAVRRGDLRLDMNLDAVVSNATLAELQIETYELLDVTPERFLKYTRSTRTFTGTGVDVVRLPIGNPLLGVLLFGTTVPVGAATTATWEQFRVKVDNVEALYAASNWDTTHGELTRRIHGPADFLSDHVHRANGGAAGFEATSGPQRVSDNLDSYAFLDFDPMKDGAYMLETAGRADVVVQRDSGTADLGRFTPVELVSVGGQAGA